MVGDSDSDSEISTVEVQLESADFREGSRERVDLTAPQLSETPNMLRKSKLSRKSVNRSRLVQVSRVTCTEVGVGDCSAKRRSCVDGIHPPHRTAEENISRRANQVVEICPHAKNPLPLMKAKVDTMPDGVHMIGANKQAYTEYIKMRVVGEDRMALKAGPFTPSEEVPYSGPSFSAI